MKVEGLKGCFQKTGDLFYFSRMCSKIRLHAQGKLPKDYHEGLGEGFDGRTCRYLRVRYEDVRAQVLSGKTDAEVLDWSFTNGRQLTEEDILIYNSFISKRGWHDDESNGFLAEMVSSLNPILRMLFNLSFSTTPRPDYEPWRILAKHVQKLDVEEYFFGLMFPCYGSVLTKKQ